MLLNCGERNQRTLISPNPILQPSSNRDDPPFSRHLINLRELLVLLRLREFTVVLIVIPSYKSSTSRSNWRTPIASWPCIALPAVYILSHGVIIGRSFFEVEGLPTIEVHDCHELVAAMPSRTLYLPWRD